MVVRTSKAEPASRALPSFLQSSRLWLSVWAAGAGLTAVAYLLPETAPPGEYQADKFIHLVVFAALGIPLRAAVLQPRGFAWLVAINAALAVALECAQSFVPGRIFSLFDIAANLLGLGFGIVAGFHLERVFGRWLRARGTAWNGAIPWRPTRVK